MRRFNVTGLCVPEEDYMVDISGKLEQIIKLIDGRSYFTINRARQYGKTTTLACLEKAIRDRYLVTSISFEGIDDESFGSPAVFCRMFVELIHDSLKFTDAPPEYRESWLADGISNFRELGRHITKMCQNRKVVLMIDEVDKTSNNQVFLHFLGMLREKFLLRKNKKDYTFHSVILVGVYDIKNIKLKMINAGLSNNPVDIGRIYNSPWNIAANFNVDMSFDPLEIATMLSEYETDHKTGMDIDLISAEIHNYTSGYPFLVSRICSCIDEELAGNWTRDGVQEAVKVILEEENVLFDDLEKNLENNKEVYNFLYSLLIVGEKKSFTIGVPVVKWCSMFGYIDRCNGNSAGGQTGYAVIANKIFEIRMGNYFITKDENASRMESEVGHGLYNDIVKEKKFNMELCLAKFAEHYREIFTEADQPFLERHGRLLFLSYLRPLINGKGFFHIESQFTDLRRMDIVVDFGSDQFIIELKLWKGEAAKDKAYEQLLAYLEAKNTAKGYLLTFDFRKEKNKEYKAEWVKVGDKQIFEVIV